MNPQTIKLDSNINTVNTAMETINSKIGGAYASVNNKNNLVITSDTTGENSKIKIETGTGTNAKKLFGDVIYEPGRDGVISNNNNDEDFFETLGGQVVIMFLFLFLFLIMIGSVVYIFK